MHYAKPAAETQGRLQALLRTAVANGALRVYPFSVPQQNGMREVLFGFVGCVRIYGLCHVVFEVAFFGGESIKQIIYLI